MNAIIADGGFRKARHEKVKVKAWGAFFAAIYLAAAAYHFFPEMSFYPYLPSVLILGVSLTLFFTEKGREVELPQTPHDYDPRKLYSGLPARR